MELLVRSEAVRERGVWKADVWRRRVVVISSVSDGMVWRLRDVL